MSNMKLMNTIDSCAYRVTMALLQALYLLGATVLNAISSSADNSTSKKLGIIGGHKVTIEDVPFIVALYVKRTNGEFEAFCGGSIVHERFVLTAAHCLYFLPDRPKRVHIGSDRLNAGGLMIHVEDEFCHEGFNVTELFNDICLLKLSEPVPLGCKVAKVTLPDEGFELEEGTMVNVTGWGDIGNNATSMENNLYQTTTPIVSEESCRKVYEKFMDDQICAGSVGHDSCQGDSGGPLTYNGVQVGIVSYGLLCGVNPGVYTKVTSYLDWIEETIQDNL